MTLMKYKTGFVMFLLLFLLSGCGSKGSSYVDHPSSYVAEQPTEQPAVNDETTIISRVKFTGENRDDYFETVNTESKLEIIDILDSETEFLVSDDWYMWIVYIYLLSDQGYEKCIYFKNYLEWENVTVHLQDNITEMYVLCPEYTVVSTVTRTDSPSAEEYNVYLVDEESKIWKKEDVPMGGAPRFRIFDIDTSAREDIRFELGYYNNSDEPYGGFVIQFE